jgi:hypothetical protein
MPLRSECRPRGFPPRCSASEIIHFILTPLSSNVSHSTEGLLLNNPQTSDNVRTGCSLPERTNQVAAMKALKIKKFIGIGYDFEHTKSVSNYFSGADFNVLGLERLPGPWEDVGGLFEGDLITRRSGSF